MIRLVRILNWFSFAFAISVVLSSFIFAFVLLAPIDIVKDWVITVDNKIYHPQDEIVLHATYTKLRDVNGTSYYYLECRNPRGSLVRYTISQQEGNRSKGTGKVDIPMKLPDTVPNLPATCHIAISVDYTVYTFRKIAENNTTNDFRVEE